MAGRCKRLIYMGIAALALSPALPGIGFSKPTPEVPLVDDRILAIRIKIVETARRYKGVPYKFGGRGTKNRPNLDCLGLMYESLDATYRKPWRMWSPDPSKLITQIDPKNKTRKTIFIDTDAKQIESLKPGDFIFFFDNLFYKNHDAPIAERNGITYQGWHTGIYTEKGSFIHASPFDGNNTVIEESLLGFMKRIKYKGFVVVSPP